MKVSQLTIAFFGSTQEQQQLQKEKDDKRLCGGGERGTSQDSRLCEYSPTHRDIKCLNLRQACS